MTENMECLILRYTATKIKRHKWDDEEILAKRCFVLNKYYSEKFRLNPINEIELQSEIPHITNTGDPERVIGKLEFIENISEKLYDDIKRLNLSDDEQEITKLMNGYDEGKIQKSERVKEKRLLNK